MPIGKPAKPGTPPGKGIRSTGPRTGAPVKSQKPKPRPGN